MTSMRFEDLTGNDDRVGRAQATPKIAFDSL
jgi:hypothetical protein